MLLAGTSPTLPALRLPGERPRWWKGTSWVDLNQHRSSLTISPQKRKVVLYHRLTHKRRTYEPWFNPILDHLSLPISEWLRSSGYQMTVGPVFLWRLNVFILPLLGFREWLPVIINDHSPAQPNAGAGLSSQLLFNRYWRSTSREAPGLCLKICLKQTHEPSSLSTFRPQLNV